MRGLVAVLLLGSAAAAFACGYCVEDKIAAVYDHAVVTRALADKHQVAFLHVEGHVAKTVLESAVNGTPGVDRGTTRVSPDLLTVAFAFDPKRASLGTIHATMEKRLARHKVSLLPFQVMAKPGDLKNVKLPKSHLTMRP